MRAGCESHLKRCSLISLNFHTFSNNKRHVHENFFTVHGLLCKLFLYSVKAKEKHCWCTFLSPPSRHGIETCSCQTKGEGIQIKSGFTPVDLLSCQSAIVLAFPVSFLQCLRVAVHISSPPPTPPLYTVARPSPRSPEFALDLLVIVLSLEFLLQQVERSVFGCQFLLQLRHL